MTTLRLGVNLDHVATLRQARRVTYPDPVAAIEPCLRAGAHSITLHLREDRRHIQDHDVQRTREANLLPLNLEMAATDEMVDFACALQPAEVCLVPEKREELTTEGGLNVVAAHQRLQQVTQRLSTAGIAVSLFVDPEPAQLEACAEVGAPIIELHTGVYCNASGAAAEQALQELMAGAKHAHQLGLQVNAGHGITIDNLDGILRLPHLDTLNIGHSIVARSVFLGMEGAVREMLDGMAKYPAPPA